MVVAIGAILVWIAFVVVMLFAADSSDLRWTRLSFVFGSVEAIAFAAAGALFGVTVQRERVQKAEEKAQQHERDAANGRALATLNIVDGNTVAELDRESTILRVAPSDTTNVRPSDATDSDVRRRHAMAARRLFPDL